MYFEKNCGDQQFTRLSTNIRVHCNLSKHFVDKDKGRPTRTIHKEF